MFLFLPNLSKCVNAQITHISARTLAEDNKTAEKLTRACILDLEARSNHPSFDPLLHMMIPRMYNILGGIQYSQQCFEQAQESYIKSVTLDQDFALRYDEHAFGPFRLHRTLTLLLWLEKQDLKTQAAPVYDLATHRSEIERDLAVTINRTENKRVRLGKSMQVPNKPRKKDETKFVARIKPLRSPQVAFDPNKTHARRRSGGGGGCCGPEPLPIPRPNPSTPVTPWG